MATTKLGNTKQSSRAINYAEKRAVVKSGHNCDVDYAKSQFKRTRELFNKNDGVQAHTIIQSFKPNETTPEQANEIGLELAKKIAPNHQVAVYTHNDTDHIHNHIVINSIDLETSKKYQSNKKQRELVKAENDNICREYGLSVPKRTSDINYTLSEQALVQKQAYSWKDDIRERIDKAKEHTDDLEGYFEALDELGVEYKQRGNTLSYKLSDMKKWVREKKLGKSYERESIHHEFEEKARRRTDKFEWNKFRTENEIRADRLNTRTEQSVKAENRTDREHAESNKREHTQTTTRTKRADRGLQL